jgi:hypothetical protein
MKHQQLGGHNGYSRGSGLHLQIGAIYKEGCPEVLQVDSLPIKPKREVTAIAT